MGATGIEWTRGPNGEPGFTFNPWIGCTKISGACNNCYAEAASVKFGSPWGPHADRRGVSESTWTAPLAWNRRAEREGRRFRVFCASMADIFDNHRSITWEWRERLWKLIAATPNLDWLLLTKRPENVHGRVPVSWWADWPRNVWFGVTGEDQPRFNHCTEHLRSIPAPVRFVSVEPQLGRIILPYDAGTFIDWIINGGESGTLSKIRDTPDEWMIQLRRQCARLGIAYFGKQLSQVRHRRDYKNFDAFPADLHVREHPQPRIAA